MTQVQIQELWHDNDWTRHLTMLQTHKKAEKRHDSTFDESHENQKKNSVQVTKSEKHTTLTMWPHCVLPVCKEGEKGHKSILWECHCTFFTFIIFLLPCQSHQKDNIEKGKLFAWVSNDFGPYLGMTVQAISSQVATSKSLITQNFKKHDFIS